jgi:penicillin-binding protein 1A
MARRLVAALAVIGQAALALSVRARPALAVAVSRAGRDLRTATREIGPAARSIWRWAVPHARTGAGWTGRALGWTALRTGRGLRAAANETGAAARSGWLWAHPHAETAAAWTGRALGSTVLRTGRRLRAAMPEIGTAARSGWQWAVPRAETGASWTGQRLRSTARRLGRGLPAAMAEIGATARSGWLWALPHAETAAAWTRLALSSTARRTARGLHGAAQEIGSGARSFREWAAALARAGAARSWREGGRVAHLARMGAGRALAGPATAVVYAVVGLGVAVVWIERSSRQVELQVRRARRQLRPVLATATPAAGRAALRTLHLVTQAAPAWGAAARRHVGGGMGSLGPALPRLAVELRHQYRQAVDVRPHFRPLQDGRGRRIRASAYRHHRGAVRRGGDMRATVYTSRLRRTGAITATAVTALLVSFFGGSQAFIDVSANLPDVHQLRTVPLPEDTLVYSADGALLADLHQPGVQRYFVPLSRMEKSWLPQAVVATEDANFWHGMAVDPQGIARAAVVDLQRGQAQQGASTITQQLVRLELLKDYSQTIDRKVKEAILAIQAQQVFNKNQILEMYLNAVHFGNQAMGAQAAARNYFRKDVDQLDLAESAMLAGIPQSPYYNDPTRNWDIAKGRQHEVLDAMVRTNMIKPAAAREAYAEDLRPELHFPDDAVKAAPAFTGWVTQELVTRYGLTATYGGGMRVTTSLNLALQGIAESAVRGNVDNDRSKNVQQGAMTAIDPRTGEVEAMVGSLPDGPAGQYNFAADVPRNPGSSFKIFTYTAAIESAKYTMTTPIQDAPITVNMPGQQQGYQPKNYDGRYHGTCQLQVCIGNSLNVPAVEVELGTGVDKVVDMSRKLGAPPWVRHEDGTLTQNDSSSSFGAALTLGGYGETPLQMASGAAAIANMGVSHPPTGIVSIAASDGTALYKYDPATTAQQVLDPRVAYIMQTIMSNDNNRAAIFGRNSALTLPGRRVGAKTGTAEDFKDAWTVGYTPALASAFWFGNPDYSSMQTGFDAIFAAAPGWQSFMSRALDALQRPGNEWYGPPPGLVGGGPDLWSLPGTRLGQPPPPLPGWAYLGSPPKSGQNPSRQGG